MILNQHLALYIEEGSAVSMKRFTRPRVFLTLRRKNASEWVVRPIGSFLAFHVFSVEQASNITLAWS